MLSVSGATDTSLCHDVILTSSLFWPRKSSEEAFLMGCNARGS